MDEPTITTSAVGRASGRPDRVDLQFAATATEPDVAGARRTVAERAAGLREVLDDVGVPEDQVRTTGFRINRPPPNRGGGAGGGGAGGSGASAGGGAGGDDPADRPHEGTETVQVTLYDESLIEPVLSGATEDAGVEIRDVTFTFRTETRRDLQREAVADGVEAAREKAAAAAAAEGSAVGDARSIVTDGRSGPQRVQAAQTLSMDTSAGGSVESGPIDVTVSVEVTYEMDAE